MKKIILYICITGLIFTLSACGSKKADKDDIKGDGKEQVLETETGGEEPESETEDMTAEKSQAPAVSDSAEETTETDPDSGTTTDTVETPSTLEKTRPDLSAEGEGILIYFDGDVDVVRDNESLEDELYEGYEIQNYDLISTGEGSSAEIEVYSSRCPETQITIMENTVFSFEINKLESSTNTTIDLLAGSVALKVSALAGDEDLDVVTGEVSMGVRGTEFTVATLPTGDALITCKSGKVECGDDATGRSLEAYPGKVVEKAGGGGMRRLDVPAREADEYLENWYDEKIRLLKDDALAEIKKFVEEYESRIEQFDQAYATLLGEKDIINKWKTEDIQGKTGSTMEMLREKKAIISHIYEIQKILFWFKHVYFRLVQLKRYHDQGFGKGEIRPGYTTTNFFASFSKADIASRLSNLRYIYKLYAKRNGGTVPVASTSDDDF